MEINLEQEKKSLLGRINKLEAQIAPLQKELNQNRDRLLHVIALMPVKGNSPKPPSKIEWGYWKKLCREQGWQVGGDSAHRVVKRKNPTLHNSIPHKCDIDGKTYPLSDQLPTLDYPRL